MSETLKGLLVRKIVFTSVIDVYSENHAIPINEKCSITDCQSRWFI
jgi:UDP-glucose 4-epimerase